MLKKCKTSYIRDVYLAYLIDGANRTKTDEFPVIERWMVAIKPPKEIIQWDRKRDVVDPKTTAISFYCNDYTFTQILNNPKAYVEKLKQYAMVIGIDASPYDNMPLVVQKSQIYLNLAITYYFASKGIKIIPNVRLGDNRTLTSLEAYPTHTLIAIGTNGFIKKLNNRCVFAEQVMRVVDVLEPSGIIVYEYDIDEIFGYARLKGIPIYRYDSYTMKENEKDRIRKLSKEHIDER